MPPTAAVMFVPGGVVLLCNSSIHSSAKGEFAIFSCLVTARATWSLSRRPHGRISVLVFAIGGSSIEPFIGTV